MRCANEDLFEWRRGPSLARSSEPCSRRCTEQENGPQKPDTRRHRTTTPERTKQANSDFAVTDAPEQGKTLPIPDTNRQQDESCPAEQIKRTAISLP